MQHLQVWRTFTTISTASPLQIGTGALSTGSSAGQYVASFSITSLLAGQHVLTVIYNGDSNYASAISNVVTVTVQQQPQGTLVLSGFTITPSTIVGGYSPQGVVTLTDNAPSGGAVVSLSSNNPHFVQVPPTVTVTPGYNNRAFLITTSFTSGTAGATITATYNGTTYGAGLTVLPVAVSGVTFYPSTVTAGDSAPLTVYLTGPAPAGTSVALTNSNPSVLSLSSSDVPVPTGGTSVSVTGSTFAGSPQTNVTVTANYNLTSGSGSLTVIPAPLLTLNTIGFSPQTVTGGTSASGTLSLTGLAPAGGVQVALSSPSTLVQVPPTVPVPAGAWYAPFTAPTSQVSSITNVTITGSYGGVSQNVTLTLVPPLPNLASLSFDPTTVNSGSTATGTVTLTAPAPLGGAFVTLTSGFIPVVRVGQGAFVAEGATSATFNAVTAPINFIQPVTITASYNGISRSVQITVVPPGTPLAPSSLTLSPAIVTGGSSSTGTVLLTGAAPSGGIVLTLSSDSAAVQVPPTVNVPAGSNSTAFAVTTSSVSIISTATVTATYNGLSQSALITVKPSSPPPGGNPVPFLAAPLVPVSRTPGGAGFSLTVNGQGFVPGAQILWNRTALPTTFVTSSQVQAPVPPGSVMTNGSALVTVSNPGAASPSSNALPEHLTYPISAPAFSTSSLSVNGDPIAVATGDFNRDGVLDIAVQNIFNLSIFLGNGDGTFGPERILPAPNSSSLAVGDFNGDGKLDIVVTKSMANSDVIGNLIGVFLGNGDGTFTAMPDTPLPSPIGATASMAVGDFNGDGALDLVVTSSNLTQAYVLLGKGDGTFGPAASVGSVNQPQSVVVADFNGDGKLDLALPDYSNQAVAILLGNGDGTFQPQRESPTNGYAVALTVADFDGDGKPDIAVANQGPCCGAGGGAAVLRGKGDGTFYPPVTYGAGQAFSFIAAEDVNGDGKLDLLITKPVLAFPGNGDGSFSSAPLTLSAATNPQKLAIADLNNDGAPDILVPNYSSGTVTVLRQTIGPVLQVAPSSFSFTFQQGAAIPSSLFLAVSNSGGGTESWSASASQSWIVLSQTSGTAPSTLTVWTNPSELAPGIYNGTITVTGTNAANSPQTVAVTLTVLARPALLLSVTHTGNFTQAQTSATYTLTVSNEASGGATLGTVAVTDTIPTGLTLVSMSGSGWSCSSNTCTRSDTLNPGFSYPPITVTVNVASNAPSQVTNQARVTGGGSPAADASDSTTIIAMGAVSLSPISINFGNQVLTVPSATQSVVLTNTGNTTLTVTAVLASGDFSQTNNCVSVDASGSCTITVTFTPTVSGPRTGAIIITANASNSPQLVRLFGAGGAAVGAKVRLSNVGLNFGAQAVSMGSAAKTVTLTNDGDAPLTVTSVSASGDFAQTNGCVGSVAVSDTCTISVTFLPTLAGIRLGVITIVDSAAGSPHVIRLFGTGSGTAPAISFSSVSLNFGNQANGVASAAKTVTVTNTGNAPLNISAITPSGDFSVSGGCLTSLGPAETCTLSITFRPTTTGPRRGGVTLTDDATGSPQVIRLFGNGT